MQASLCQSRLYPLRISRSIKQHFEPVFVGQAHWRTKKKGMRIFEIRLRSFPRRPRTSRPPPSPSNSSTFFPSDIDIHYRRPQRSESDSTSSTSSYLIGRSRLWPRTYWETGRRGMNPPQHKNWFTSWFHRRALPRRKTNLPRRDETHRAFVVDAPEDTKPRLRRQLPLPAVFRASPGTRAQPASSRMDYTFTESLGRPRSGSRNRDVLEIREVCELHTEVPRTESRRSSPTSRVRPVSPGIDGSRGRSRSRFRAPREIYEVHEARPAEPDTRDINFRPPRERTPVVEREPRRSGRWISPIRQGRTRRTSPSSDRRSDPEPRLPRPIVRRPGARGTATREERWIMTSRIPSPITNNERSRAESKPRRTVQRSPQRQPSPEVIVERCPRAERPAIIHDGRRELSKRVIHRNYVGDAPRVRFQEPSHFVDPPVTRVFRRRRNRQERFIDERGPLDRWR